MNTGNFVSRYLLEGTWNSFCRTDGLITPNYAFIDALQAAGFTHLVIFWGEREDFSEAWKKLIFYAHEKHIKVIKGLYLFWGTEDGWQFPAVPRNLMKWDKEKKIHIVCPGNTGAQTFWRSYYGKLCSEFEFDGFMLETARTVDKECHCDKCRENNIYAQDRIIINRFLSEIPESDREFSFVAAAPQSGQDTLLMMNEYKAIDQRVKYFFNSRINSLEGLQSWMNMGERFSPLYRTGRFFLFPDGKPRKNQAAFICRSFKTAAGAGKTAVAVEYRLNGGRHYPLSSDRKSVVIPFRPIPASLLLIGKAAENPCLSSSEQKAVLNEILKRTVNDLNDPLLHYFGLSGPNEA
ncbi:MAG: hypothetical protein PHV82_00255 [Victivallaceae bacterium]|nr:hypothetical protein [Victivallaceae bacterium]